MFCYPHRNSPALIQRVSSFRLVCLVLECKHTIAWVKHSKGSLGSIVIASTFTHFHYSTEVAPVVGFSISLTRTLGYMERTCGVVDSFKDCIVYLMRFFLICIEMLHLAFSKGIIVHYKRKSWQVKLFYIITIRDDMVKNIIYSFR